MLMSTRDRLVVFGASSPIASRYLTSNFLHHLSMSSTRSFDLNFVNVKAFECSATLIIATYYWVLTVPSIGRAQTSRYEVVEKRFQCGRAAAYESGVHLENPDGISVGRSREN